VDNRLKRLSLCTAIKNANRIAKLANTLLDQEETFREFKKQKTVQSLC
jgi:hypothetical protein